MSDDQSVARKIFFHGRVQGVGFRWTTAKIATSFDVVGTVRNRRDGTVELVAQSSPVEVQKFVDRILERFASNVTSMEDEEITVDPSLSEFSILP